MSIESNAPTQTFYAGFAALLGRPNVGKSTLLNAILDEKVAAVTPKPQTTRERILGVKNFENTQIAFVDTPGFHQAKREINRFMMRETLFALEEVDVSILLIDVNKRFHNAEKKLLEILEKSQKKTILALNKIDTLKDRSLLLPLLLEWEERFSFLAMVPISARKNDGVSNLLTEIKKQMPKGAPLFPEDEFTDKPIRFFIAEFIREQVFLCLGEEIPYASAVTIESYKEPAEKNRALQISATIHVERSSQKAIMIGKGGQMLKKIGQSSREEIEKFLQQKVFLELFVRVEPNWSRDPKAMKKLGLSQ